MSGIANLGYVVLGVSDFVRWKEFAANLGLQLGCQSERSISFRMDEYEQRVILENGIEDDIRAAGWEFTGEAELESFVQELRLKGVHVECASSQQAQQRGVQKLYSVQDPNGFQDELYCGPSIVDGANKFSSPTLKGGFVTGRLGLGHLLVKAVDVSRSLDFYQESLGLQLSDRVREEIAPGRVIDVTFMHAATGRHHSLATGKTSGNKILNHFMLEVDSMDDVGLAYDRCIKAGYTIQAELGRHPNDQVFSFYVCTPSGFAIELGYGGIVIDDEKWTPVVYDKLSAWGHKRKALAAPSN